MGKLTPRFIFNIALAKYKNEQTAQAISEYAKNLLEKDLPVIFSIKHFCKILQIDYSYLLSAANEIDCRKYYFTFKMSKRSGGKRIIHVPKAQLFKAQSFINKNILSKMKPSEHSYAYAKEASIYNCANQHCGSRYLFQFDLKDFFHTILEPDIYQLFKNAGYTTKISLFFARLCTTTYKIEHRYLIRAIHRTSLNGINTFNYRHYWGVLPQGAPTSPMLSNLVCKELDTDLATFAESHQLTYTRYADDITFSSTAHKPSISIPILRYNVKSIIYKHHFFVNEKKIRIAGPCSKKVVLGLLVDHDEPKLQKETRQRIVNLLYQINQYSIKSVAERKGFHSTFGLYNHVCGLMNYAKSVDPKFYEKYFPMFTAIKNPIFFEE